MKVSIKKDNPQEFIYIGILQVTGHPTEIPPAISTGCQGPVLVAKKKPCTRAWLSLTGKFGLSNVLIKVELPPWTIWKADVSSVSPSSTFKCTRTRCKTCPLISNMGKISGPNRSVKITYHFTCISVNVMYCITCTLCKKTYTGETGRRLANHFREHLRDVKKRNDTDASKPVPRHFSLPNHSHHNMTICGLSLHHGNTESRKNLKKKIIFQLSTLHPREIIERLSYHKFIDKFMLPYFHQWQSSFTPAYKPTTPTIPLFALTKG